MHAVEAQSVVLISFLIGTLTALSGCGEPECPDGFDKMGKVCRRHDAGELLDSAVGAVSPADGSTRRDDNEPEGPTTLLDAAIDDSAVRISANLDAARRDGDGSEGPECTSERLCSSGYACVTGTCISKCDQKHCDPNATCAITGDIAVCTCNSGYVSKLEGGEVLCIRDAQCADLGCDPSAACEVGADMLRHCVCKAGYTGTGTTCSPISCGPLSVANGSVATNGATFGQIAIYSCDSGYSKVGGTVRKCEAAGWSGTAPTCAPFDCGALTAPAHGAVTVTNGTTYPNGSVRYSCEPGFELSSATADRSCTATGWSGSAPACLGCGDGVVTRTREDCDYAAPMQSPWTCDRSCRTTGNYAACLKDADCPSGLLCTNFSCSPSCSVASQCPAVPAGTGGTLRCDGFACFIGCSSSAQCPPGLICDAVNLRCAGCSGENSSLACPPPLTCRTNEFGFGICK